MNINTKLEVAVDIMSTKIARAVMSGEDPNGELLQTLFYEKNEMYKCNEEIIDKIIEVYGKQIKEDLKK